jgi:hypothetical protein
MVFGGKEAEINDPLITENVSMRKGKIRAFTRARYQASVIITSNRRKSCQMVSSPGH